MLRYLRVGALLLIMGLSTFVVLHQNANFTADVVQCGPGNDTMPCTCGDGRAGMCVGNSCYCYDSCGDGVKGEFEQCDDGNFDSGDGCDYNCKLECGTCELMYEDPFTSEKYYMCVNTGAEQTGTNSWSCPEENSCSKLDADCTPGGSQGGSGGGTQSGQGGLQGGLEGGVDGGTQGGDTGGSSQASSQASDKSGSSKSSSEVGGSDSSNATSSKPASSTSSYAYSSNATSYKQSSDDSDSSTSSESCGDGECSENENCSSCPDDCGCQGEGCSAEQCVEGECRAPSQQDANKNCPPPQDACKPYVCQMGSGECKVEKIDAGAGVNVNGESCSCTCQNGELSDCLPFDTYKNSCFDVEGDHLPNNYENPFPPECSEKLYEYFESLDYSNEDTWNLEENMNKFEGADAILPGEEFNQDIGGGGGGTEKTDGCSQVMIVSCDFENSCNRARFRNAWAGKKCCNEGKEQAMLGPENPGDTTYNLDFFSACNGAATGSIEIPLCPCEDDSSSASSTSSTKSTVSSVASSGASTSSAVSSAQSSQSSVESSQVSSVSQASSQLSSVTSSQSVINSSAVNSSSSSIIIAFSSFSFDFSSENSNQSQDQSNSSTLSFDFSAPTTSSAVSSETNSSASNTQSVETVSSAVVISTASTSNRPNDQTNNNEGNNNQSGNRSSNAANEQPRLSSSPQIATSTPRLVAAAGVCGDGTLNVGEECDDSNRRDNDGCSASCYLEIGICGDGIVQRLLGEQCEQVSHDKSLPYSCVRCQFVSLSCGDGVVDPGEECDEGPQNSTSPDANCRPNCRIGACGDGIVDSTEQCDDGNRLSGDGCDRYCGQEVRSSSSSSAPTAVASDTTNIPFNTAQPYGLPYGFQFPYQATTTQIPYQLPLAQLQPIIQGQAPVGDTGPAAVAVLGAGAAAGWSYMRRRK